MEPATVPLQNLPAYVATVSDVISHLYDLGQAGWPIRPPFPQLGSGMGWAQQSLVMPVHCRGPGGWGWTRAQGMLGGFGESGAALPPSVPGPGASFGPRCLENSGWIPQVGCSNMHLNGEGSLGGVGWWQAVLSPHGVCVCVCEHPFRGTLLGGWGGMWSPGSVSPGIETQASRKDKPCY